MTAARRPSLSFLLIMEINGRLRIKSCALMLQPGLRAASRPVIQALGYVGRRSEQATTAGTRCRCMGGREGEREEEGGRCVWGEGIGSERVRGGYRKKRRREERQRAMRWREESCPQIDPQQHQTASASPSSLYLPLSLPPSISLYLSSLARSLTRSLLRNRLKKGKKNHTAKRGPHSETSSHGGFSEEPGAPSDRPRPQRGRKNGSCLLFMFLNLNRIFSSDVFILHHKPASKNCASVVFLVFLAYIRKYRIFHLRGFPSLDLF